MFTPTICLDSDEEIEFEMQPDAKVQSLLCLDVVDLTDELPVNEKNKSKDGMQPDSKVQSLSSLDAIDLTDELADPCGPTTLESMNISTNEVRLVSILEAYMNLETPTTSTLDLQTKALNGLNEYKGHLEDLIDLTDDPLKESSGSMSTLLHIQPEPILESMDVTINEEPSLTASESYDKHTTNLATETFSFLLDSWLKNLDSNGDNAEPAVMKDKALDTSCSENTVDVIDLTEEPAKLSSTEEAMDVTINEEPSPTATETNDEHTTNLADESYLFLLESWLKEMDSNSVNPEPAVMKDKALDTSCSENTVNVIEPAKLSSSEEAADIVVSANDNNDDTEWNTFLSDPWPTNKPESNDIRQNPTIEENVWETSCASCSRVGIKNSQAKSLNDSSEKHLVEPSVPLESALPSPYLIEAFVRVVNDLSEKHFVEPSAPLESVLPSPSLIEEPLDKKLVGNRRTSKKFAENDAIENVLERNTRGRQKKDLRLKRLTILFNELKQKITNLEEREVDLNDDVSSDFIMIEEYKLKAFKIYEEICEITGQNKRKIKKPIKFEETQYPEFNRKMEKIINEKGNTPHVLDVLRCLELCNSKYKYKLSKESCHKIARNAFLHVGKTSQKRRKIDLDEMLSYYTRNAEPDPALNDAELSAKLNANKKCYSK